MARRRSVRLFARDRRVCAAAKARSQTGRWRMIALPENIARGTASLLRLRFRLGDDSLFDPFEIAFCPPSNVLVCMLDQFIQRRACDTASPEFAKDLGLMTDKPIFPSDMLGCFFGKSTFGVRTRQLGVTQTLQIVQRVEMIRIRRPRSRREALLKDLHELLHDRLCRYLTGWSSLRSASRRFSSESVVA